MKKKNIKRAIDTVFRAYYESGLTATAHRIKINLLNELTRLDKRK